MKIKAPPFRPLDFTMQHMPRLDLPKYVYFSTGTAALTDAVKARHVEIGLLLAEIRGIVDVEQDEFDEWWQEFLCEFCTHAPLLLARALREFVLEGGKLPIIP